MLFEPGGRMVALTGLATGLIFRISVIKKLWESNVHSRKLTPRLEKLKRVDGKRTRLTAEAKINGCRNA